jgi:ubiquinone/menaquinone biosynthesis C-methylase UbiE
MVLVLPFMTAVDIAELTARVRGVYREVALHPHGTYHFEMGRPLAERLGYDVALLDRIPVEAVESFAGVGHFFDLADLQPGEKVIDLGSGSGTDAFCAAILVGPSGQVVGVDFTPAQLGKARRLAAASDPPLRVDFRRGRIEELPAADGAFDCVISNGVINLSPDKERVFAEAARVLSAGGRLAVADIVTERPLTEQIVCDAELWASCIGGAAQQDDYRSMVEGAGLRIAHWRENPYQFLSGRARSASSTYGVRSVTVVAVKEARAR